jgi:hypothetical protein
MRVTTLSSLVAVTGMLVSFAAQAQEAPAGGEATPAAAPETTPPPAATTSAKGIIGADAAVAIPFGDFSNGAGIGFGALFRAEYNLIPNLNLTGRAGFIYHLPKDTVIGDIKFYEVPILAGVKYAFADAFYGAAELGLVWGKASTDGGSASETNLGFTIGAGYRLDALDFRAGIHILDLGNAGDSTELVLNAGYNFAAF